VRKRPGKRELPATRHADDLSDADRDAFARAMADVVPLPRDGKERVRRGSDVSVPTTTRQTASPLPETSGEDNEATFVAPGVDRRELRKLKRGHYPVGSRIDLHGMTASEAVAHVKHFIEDSRHSQHRAVCIVHGRGLHSDANVAVLRGRVREWLRSHRAVLAYADAPASDGGAGAVYVLLRK
jgi:DNA-nicking Smr family endonuclease